MRQKNLVKVGALAMGAAMIGSVFSVPAFAANSDGTPTKVTETGAISIDASSVEGTKVTGHKYNIYKVMDKYDAGSDGTNKIYQYKLTDAFKDFTSENFAIDVNTGKITTKQAITIGGETYAAGTVVDSSKSDTTNTNSALVSVLASELAKYAYGKQATATSENGATADGLEQGWYLVAESETNTKDGLVATKPILLNLTATGDVATMKDSRVTLDKSFAPDGGAEGAALVKEDNFDIGDTINYTITSVLPTYAANVDAASVKFTMTDTMSDGLTPPAASAVVVKIDKEVVTTVTPAINGQVLTIDVPADVVLANQGKSIVVEYPCVLNDKALYNSTPDATNNNKVVLDFSNNPLVNKDSKQLEDKTKVYTYAVDFQKIDGAHGDLLEGAKFTLKKGDATIKLVKTSATDVDEYRPAIGEEAGEAVFTTSKKEVRFIGLDDGTYTLTETEAPSGFSKLSGPLSFTITGTKGNEDKLTGAATVTSGSDALKLVKDDNTASDGIITAKAENAAPEVNLQVKNYEGISLPSTGAMTSLIVTGAGAAVIGGGLFFGLRRKKDEDED